MSEEQKTPLLEVKNIKKMVSFKEISFFPKKRYILKLSTASALH